MLPRGPATPQAKSEDELDAYGLILDSTSRKQTIKRAQQFMVHYPKSEFCGYALIQEMYAYWSLNEFGKLLIVGRAALRHSPNNINVLTTLADAIADNLPASGSKRKVLLAEAEDDATEACRQLNMLKRPFDVPRLQFGTDKQQTRATIAATLGLIALDRGSIPRAITEYKVAISLSPKPRGVDYYRLGGAYLLNGQVERALEMLKKAASLGPHLITALAQEQILKVQKVQTAGPPTER